MEELIRDGTDKTLKKYFTIVPNTIDDMDLSPYAFRLYCHYKRVAGDNGACWQSVETLSKACKMSTGSVVKARKELEAAGLIEVTHQSNPHGGRDYNTVTMVDIWNTNMKSLSSSLYEVASSSGELIKNPINNIPSPSTITPIKLNHLTRLRRDIDISGKKEKPSFLPSTFNESTGNEFPDWIGELEYRGYPNKKKLRALLKTHGELQVRSVLTNYLDKQAPHIPHWTAALNAAEKFFEHAGAYDYNVERLLASK